jgi:hypothetical protein
MCPVYYVNKVPGLYLADRPSPNPLPKRSHGTAWGGGKGVGPPVNPG